MQQNWSIRSRAHQCALTNRPFEDGEIFHTAIYFDPQENGYVRRDISAEAWAQEMQAQEHPPIASWKTLYQKVEVEAKPEIAPKESAQELLQRFLQVHQIEQRAARFELDEEIDVALGRLVAPGDRAEQGRGPTTMMAHEIADLSPPGFDNRSERAHQTSLSSDLHLSAVDICLTQGV